MKEMGAMLFCIGGMLARPVRSPRPRLAIGSHPYTSQLRLWIPVTKSYPQPGRHLYCGEFWETWA